MLIGSAGTFTVDTVLFCYDSISILMSKAFPRSYGLSRARVIHLQFDRSVVKLNCNVLETS